MEVFQSLYQQWEREKLSPNTIRLIHGITSEALKDAVQWRKLAYNPAQGVKLPKEKKAAVHVLSDEEMVRLFQCARQTRFYVLFRMALLLGMRIGNYIVGNNIRRYFDELLQAAGIEHMKFHALRHNASLILRKLKIDPVVRKEMLGHSHLDMTDGLYGHTTPDMHEQAAQKIDRLLDEGKM